MSDSPIFRIPLALGLGLALSAGLVSPAGAAVYKAGVTVTPAKYQFREGSTREVVGEYDLTGGTPTGDFVFVWGDGDSSTAAPVAGGAGQVAAADHAYGDDGVFAVIVKVPVGGDFYKGKANVTVQNVAPSVAPIEDTTAVTGFPVEVAVSFSDPGFLDTHTATIDWGDGTIDVESVPFGDRSLTVTHTFREQDSYAAEVFVTDDDGAVSAVEPFEVVIVRGCGGSPVTIDMPALGITETDGTPGDDVIIGTAGPDRIHAGAGDDKVCSAGGADFVDGGAGNDLLIGEGGNDRLIGGAGNDDLRGKYGSDRLLGMDGADTASGGYGEDLVVGGAGNDDLRGGGGNDVLRGAEGNDLLSGGKAADVLYGGSGNDALSGGKGPDRLEGGTHRDVLHGGAHADDLFGGGGNDLLFHSEDPNLDDLDGGAGEDAEGIGRRGDLDSGIRNYVTAAEAMAFHGSFKLSQFTTYHDCCENRVVNIQLMADTVNGHVVMPGERFSINDVVGRRTTEKGYKAAGAIIGGYVQCCNYSENIGGGTSQFATTFYNAIFFAGMEDIFHRPHTIWFSRYPEGREATMGYPYPDVVFRNDTANPVVITTHHDGYRGKSITVKFWGDNEGRQVTARKSSRYNWGSLQVIYEPNDSLSPGEEKIISTGTAPYSIDVFRDIDYPDGSNSTEKWTVRYNSPRVVERHPCEIPGSGISCPAPPPTIVLPPGWTGG